MNDQRTQSESKLQQFGRHAHASGRSTSKFEIFIWMIAGLAGVVYVLYEYATNASSIMIKYTWLFIAICALRSLFGLFQLRAFWGKEKPVEGKDAPVAQETAARTGVVDDKK